MNIINALGNRKISEKIEYEYRDSDNIIDVQYKEGIIELMEKNYNIDLIILSEILPGEITNKELIEKVKDINKKVEVIIFLENKNEYLEKYLNEKNINNIFYNNEMQFSNLIKIINKIKISKKKLNNEIEIIKEIILNDNKININKYLNKTKNKKFNNCKIINVIGNKKSGKTIVSTIIALILKSQKILLIDFNLLNNNLYTIFQIKKMPNKIDEKINNKTIKLNDFKIRINNKIDLLTGTEILLKKNIVQNINMKEEIENLSKSYEYIIIDNQMENNVSTLKDIFNLSNINILITEPNLTELKETKQILEKCRNELKIESNKIGIIFNKYNQNSIDNKILKKLFYDFNIIGKINYNKYFNLLINNNVKIINKKTKKGFKKIIEKIN